MQNLLLTKIIMKYIIITFQYLFFEKVHNIYWMILVVIVKALLSCDTKIYGALSETLSHN